MDESVATKEVHSINEQLMVTAHIFGNKNLPPEKGDKEQIEKADKSGRIKQSPTSDEVFRAEDETRVIKPPQDLQMLARASLLSSRLFKSIDIMAKNVVGLGFQVIDTLTIQERRNVDDKTAKEIKEQKKNLENFLENANDENTFDGLMRLEKTDEETVGNGYLEVIRDNSDEITNLNHIPGRTVRLARLRGPGKERDAENIKDEEIVFLQVRGTRKRWFIPFGSDLIIDPIKGIEIEGDTTREDMATELIHFKLEHPSDDFYGIPRWTPAIPSITGNRLSDIRNIKFMENDATPRIAILISGGNLDPSSIESIEKFIDLQGRGVENASRVMVLQTERKMVGPQAGDAPKIDLVPLTIGIQDDASFLKYRAANNDEIKEVFGLSDLFYGMSRDINRAAAAVAKQVTNEQEFEPERKRIVHKLKHILLPELPFDTDLVTIKFGSPLINDLASLADGISKASAAGGLTPHDIREMAGREPYPRTPEYDWADYPMPIAQLFIPIGLFGTTDDVDDMPARQPENRQPKEKPEESPGEETEDDEEEDDDEQEKTLGPMGLAIKNMRNFRKNQENMMKRLIKETIKEMNKE
ncbi:MAG TPA: phage portal protein [bacterium]|nr:phage portal protein [bacterium]